MKCHCGRPVTWGFDGDHTHTRGLCVHCDLARCDAYPLDCPYNPVSQPWYWKVLSSFPVMFFIGLLVAYALLITGIFVLELIF